MSQSPAAPRSPRSTLLRRVRAVRRLACPVVLLLAMTVIGPLPRADAAVSCGTSAGGTLCLTVPDGTVAGDQVISATWSGPGSPTVEFYLDGDYLNFEYQKPYSFVWPTAKEIDGRHTITARVHPAGSTYGQYVSAKVTLRNGNATAADIPRSPANYQQLWKPRQGNLLAGVGNLGAEKPQELQLLEYIRSTNPAAFLYLGEVHEFGTWATTRDHYGLASFDDPSGVGTLWGTMAGYTLATPGNHQRGYYDVFSDYWHQRPFWSTAVVNGIRIYDLTSECAHLGGCGPNGTQGRWLANQLATHTEPCVLGMWHRPLVSMDKKRSGTTMLPTWTMLANGGGDLVVNADTRDMEEVKPMNGALETGKRDSHMVELVSGAGAARWVTSNTSDPRVAWRLYKTPGAVWIGTSGDTLTWQFRSSAGDVLRRGSVSC